MPDEIDDKKIDDDKTKDDDGVDDGKKGNELTLESLKEIVTDQAGLIESLKAENTKSIAGVMEVIQDKYGLMESDMQNLTNLLGRLAKSDDATDDTADLTDPDNVKKLVKQTMDDGKKEESEATEKESKAYWKEYGEVAQELMGEEGPDGKLLSQEARDGIKKLLIETVVEKTTNASRDAHKNFKKASKIFFGLDKTHGFQGGEVKGTGGGGGGSKSETKKVYKLTDEAKKLLKDLGETEEWGQEMMAKQEQLA